MIVLHAAKIHLGQSISDAEIEEGKLMNLFRKEDFHVPAWVSIFRCYLFDLLTASEFNFIDASLFFLAQTNSMTTLFSLLESSDIIIL